MNSQTQSSSCQYKLNIFLFPYQYDHKETSLSKRKLSLSRFCHACNSNKHFNNCNIITTKQNKTNQTKDWSTERTLYSLAVRAYNNKEQPKHFRNVPPKNERKKLKTLRQKKKKREKLHHHLLSLSLFCHEPLFSQLTLVNKKRWKFTKQKRDERKPTKQGFIITLPCRFLVRKKKKF